MNHWPLTLARQQRRENTCRSHLTTGGPGKDQGTHKLPPTRILERSKRDGRLQSRGPTNFPGFFSLESISAERWVCPQEGCQFRMTVKRQARKEPNDHKTWDSPFPSGRAVLSVSLTLRPSYTPLESSQGGTSSGAMGPPAHQHTHFQDRPTGLAPAARWNTWNTSRSTPQRQSKLFIRSSVYNSGIKLWLQKGKMTWPRTAMIFYRTRENWLQWNCFFLRNCKAGSFAYAIIQNNCFLQRPA